MADFFAFDIQPTRVSGVGVSRDGKVNVVSACATVPSSPETLEDALAEVCRKVGYQQAVSVVTLGTELLSFATLGLPFNDKRKIEQVLPFELDDIIPMDINSRAYDFLVTPKASSASELIVAMLSKTYLFEILDILQRLGVSPDKVGVSGQGLASSVAEYCQGKVVVLDPVANSIAIFLYVDGALRMIRTYSTGESPAREALVSPRFQLWLQQTLLASRIVNVRSPDFSVALTTGKFSGEENDQFSARFPGVKISDIPPQAMSFLKFADEAKESYIPEVMDRIIALFTFSERKFAEFNFRKRDFRKSMSLRDYRKYALGVGVPIMVLFVLTLAYFVQDYSSKMGVRDKLQQEIGAVFAQTLPEVSRVVNPLQQLQVAVNEKKAIYRPSGGQNQFNVLKILTELSARIPAQYKVRFVRMVADVETIRLRGVTMDFNTVDSIQKLLEKSPMFESVSISSANQSLQDNEVRFELKLDLVE